jgi:hypothetical protein
VFRAIKIRLRGGDISGFDRNDQQSLLTSLSGESMRLSWPQHLETSRVIESTQDSHRGIALALMGMALLMLAQDLLEQEQAAAR